MACFQLGYQPVGNNSLAICKKQYNLICIIIYAGATAIYNSFYGKHSSIFHMSSVGCSGTERQLMDCSHSKLPFSTCGDGQFAGVRCLGETNIAIVIVEISMKVELIEICRGM